MAAAAAVQDDQVFDAAYFNGKRVNAKQRAKYVKDQQDLKAYLAEHDPESLNPIGNANGEIDVARLTGKPKLVQEWILSHKKADGGLKRKWSYTPFRSALHDYIIVNQKGSEVVAGYQEAMTAFFTGFNKHEAELKQAGDLPSKEGKDELPHEVYYNLGTRGYTKLGDKAGVEFEAYLKWAWNLMCRTNNVSKLCFQHLALRGDALGVRFHVTKTNKEGMVEQHKHVFANPEKPGVCPILALAIYFACNPNIQGNEIFVGKEAASRFLKQLQELCTDDGGVELLEFLGEGKYHVHI